MSYYFEMRFANAKSRQEAYQIAMEFVQENMSESNIRKAFWDNLNFSPQYKNKRELECLRKANCFSAENALIDNWIQKLFNFQFIYWEKYGLLGFLQSFAYIREPDERDPRFSNAISFQNSVEQDYEFSHWDHKIDYFANKIKEFEAFVSQPVKNPEDAEQILRDLAKRETLKYLINDTFLDEDQYDRALFDKEFVEYVIRVSLYTEIFSELDFYDFVYNVSYNINSSAESFDLFAISGINKDLLVYREVLNSVYKEARE